jgi:hypothetical protein
MDNACSGSGASLFSGPGSTDPSGVQLKMRPIKHFEKGLTYVAKGAFNAIKSVNQFKPNPSFIPKWSDKPEVMGENKADAWFSARDRLALS